MGLSVDKKTKDAFLIRHGALTRGEPAALSPQMVVIDLSAVLRMSFPALGKGPKTPGDLAHYVVRKYITPHTTAKCIVVAFDSYGADDLHELRITMHSTSRHRKATDDEIAMLDSEKQVLVNGRIYAKGQHPYTDAEVATWRGDVQVLPERAVAGRRGKLRLYELVLETMEREVAEYIAKPMTAAADEVLVGRCPAVVRARPCSVFYVYLIRFYYSQ